MDRVQGVLSVATTQHRIAKTDDGYVHYGDTLLLRHGESGRVVSYVAQSHSLEGDTLPVAAAQGEGLARLHRSVFTIAPRGHSMLPGQPLCFGEQFSLVATDPFGLERNLHSQRISLHGGASLISGKQSVSLAPASDKPNHDHAWEVLCIDPSYRLETEGQPVPANAPILLRHVASHQLLAVLDTHLVRSELGAEPEVVCHTFLSQYKIPLPPHHFILELDVDMALSADSTRGDGAAVDGVAKEGPNG